MESVKNEIIENEKPYFLKMIEEEKERKQKEEEASKYITLSFLGKLRDCIEPVLKRKNVANKYSPVIPYYMNEFLQSQTEYYKPEPLYEYAEMYLLDNINLKTYSNWYKGIIDSSALLIGKILLQHSGDYIEIDDLMLHIRNGLCNIDYLRNFLDSYLFDEADYTNSEDYADLCSDITEARKEFSFLYDNYENINFQYLDLKNIPGYAVSTIEKTRAIYEKLLELGSKIFQLTFDDKLYPYIYNFKQFAKRVADTLFYLTGQGYMDISRKYYNEYKMRNAILKHFDKLERSLSIHQYNLSYIFRELNENAEYGSCTDKEIFNSYQELKKVVNNIFNSF